MKNFNLIILILISMVATTAFAATKAQPSESVKQGDNAAVQTKNSVTIKEPTDFQKVVDEYKEYVSKIPANLREEIIAYRKEVAKINKEKRALYKKLSEAGQDYLKKEQEYKKRLPLNRKSLINVETPGEKAPSSKDSGSN